MKKSMRTIFVVWFVWVFALFGMAGCSPSKDESQEEFCGDAVGAYFITDESYEKYVRDCAASVGADEQWVCAVLQGGDGGPWHDLIRPQSWFWCAIAQNRMTVCMMEDTVYDISADGEVFQGSSISGTISFWFNGDILCIRDGEQTIEFEKDGSYRQAEKEVVLRSPQNIRVSSGEEENGSVLFQWEYRADYGRVGAAIEIQKPGSREYVPIKKIERVYMNLFTVQLDGSYFDVGENHVRFCHVGGPSITNDHYIVVNEDSDYVTYRVIVDENGNMKVKQ